MKAHKHHIVPKHAGGSDDPSNLVELSVQEHAEAHRLLWETHGMTADFLAWKMLSGKTEEVEAARIELAKEGFRKFLETDESLSWKENISKSLRGKKHTLETVEKRSKSLKQAYMEGRRDCWFANADKSFFTNNCTPQKIAKMAEGRRRSSAWKESVTSEEYRRKKSESDPRSKKITVNGIEYPSIRSAAKGCGVSYSRLRTLLNGQDFITF